MVDFKLIQQYILGLFQRVDPCVIEDEEEQMSMIDLSKTIIVEREYHEFGTHGDMYFPDETMIHTLENPWKNNERKVSCIPEGIYPLVKRFSPIVERISKGKYKEGYEVTQVDGRDWIMLHAGNYVRNTDGCPLTGMSKDFTGNEPVVWKSGEAFDIFMNKMVELGIENIWFKEKGK